MTLCHVNLSQAEPKIPDILFFHNYWHCLVPPWVLPQYSLYRCHVIYTQAPTLTVSTLACTPYIPAFTCMPLPCVSTIWKDIHSIHNILQYWGSYILHFLPDKLPTSITCSEQGSNLHVSIRIASFLSLTLHVLLIWITECIITESMGCTIKVGNITGCRYMCAFGDVFVGFKNRLEVF